jgi:hypothetical protein
MAAPNSHKDPYWSDLSGRVEAKLDLPKGLLVGIVTRGERSNNDQVSEAGAKTPFQIIPATRQAAIKKYGIDPMLSPENAAEVAGRLLKESIDRNGGDVASAVAEYHGGTNRDNWGPKTRSYVDRVMTGMSAPVEPQAQIESKPLPAQDGMSTFDRVSKQLNKPQESQIANVLAAYQAGKMAPEDAKQFEKDVSAGLVMLPRGASLKPATQAAQPQGAPVLPDGVIDAYAQGKMAPQDKAQLEADIKAGLVRMPAGVQLGASSAVARIPGAQPGAEFSPAAPDPTLLDKAVGVGEAGLQAVTGLIGGTVGMGVGMGSAITGAITDTIKGVPDTGQNDLQAAMSRGAAGLTYSPRTPAGQEYGQATGEVLAPLMGAVGLPGEMAALGMAARPVGMLAQDARAAGSAKVAPAVQRVQQAATGVVDRVRGAQPEPTPTPGTLASGGSAGADMALQRRTNADSLPVPIKLTKGQETRSFEQQRFEQETAKDPYAGAPLRERYAEQNDNILRNFDSMVDQQGGEAPTLRAVGSSVDSALVEQMKRDKTQIRVAYKEAEKAGEMAAPVSLNGVVDYLNANAPDAATAPVLTAVRKWAVKLGIAEERNGELVPAGGERPAFSTLTNEAGPAQGVTLKTAETFRQAINRATDFEPTNIRQATILKDLIDQATEGAGGDLYKQARALRAEFAKDYENRANVAKLVSNKRGMADRQVALEDVFNHTILNSSLDDVTNLSRVLHRSGPEGAQAWKDLKGQTMQWIKDQATKSVATDIRGNQIVSASGLDRALKALDHDGKLDFIFGKQGAQTVRDLNDLVKVVHTSPPGSVNTSNTASVLLAALTEAGATGAITGLPVPVLTGLKALSGHMKNRRLQARVQEALGNKAKGKPDLKSVPKTTESGKPVH